MAAASVQPGQVVAARELCSKCHTTGCGRGRSHRAAEWAKNPVEMVVDPGTAVPISFIGRAPALKQQAQPLLFRVEQPNPALVVGRPVAVVIQFKQELSGIVVPASAVVRAGNGLPQVWELVSAERFEAIAVRTAPLDGKNVLITAGVQDGPALCSRAPFVNRCGEARCSPDLPAV